MHMKKPALTENSHKQSIDSRSFLNYHLLQRTTRSSMYSQNAGNSGILNFLFFNFFKKSHILGVTSRPSTFDIGNTSIFKAFRNANLIINGKGNTSAWVPSLRVVSYMLTWICSFCQPLFFFPIIEQTIRQAIRYFKAPFWQLDPLKPPLSSPHSIIFPSPQGSFFWSLILLLQFFPLCTELLSNFWIVLFIISSADSVFLYRARFTTGKKEDLLFPSLISDSLHSWQQNFKSPSPPRSSRNYWLNCSSRNQPWPAFLWISCAPQQRRQCLGTPSKDRISL